jgi:hypothetical protein
MKKPRTQEHKFTQDEAEVLDLQIYDVLQAWSHSEDRFDLKVLARSCYLQGLIDGCMPEVVSRVGELRAMEKLV